MQLPANISVNSAKLPRTYEAAKHALANCVSIDECQEWANKAEALASYAKQADDDTLRKYADRIQARAVRRCGELLKTYDARPHNSAKQKDSAVHLVSRTDAARGAGLSERQQKTAVRVANVPRDKFDREVDGEKPPTVTKLAEMGKRTYQGPRPDNFAKVARVMGSLRRFAELAAELDAAEMAQSVTDKEIREARQLVGKIDHWLDRFVVNLSGR